MFSSLSKSLTSYLPKGPKSLIASYLSSALASYFDVDKQKIESTLLSDARIVLRDARLRPQTFRQGSAVVTTLGTVEEVVFSWRWSYPGGGGSREADELSLSERSSSSFTSGVRQAQTGMIRDAKLSIRGLDFTLLLEPTEDGSWDDDKEEDNPVPASNCEDSKTTEGYLQKYLQQIIDHLTLRIEDFQIAVEMVGSGCNGRDSFSIVTGGERIELISMGRLADRAVMSSGHSLTAERGGEEHLAALDQRISFRSLFANVLERSAERTKSHPLIEPITYVATVTRLSGRRFVDGIFSGLEVLGQSWDDVDGNGRKDDSIVFRAGLMQIQAVCLFQTLVADPAKAAGDEENPRDIPLQRASGTASTLFTLPISNLSVILPNDTALSVPHSVFTYRVDGKVCRIQGREGSGIWLDQKGLLEFESATGNMWLVDFTQSSLTVGSACAIQSGRTALLRMESGSMKKLLDGVAMIASSQFVADLSTKLSSAAGSEPANEDSSLPWSLSAKGKIAVRLEATIGGKDKWLELSLDSPSVALSSGGGSSWLSDLCCAGFSVGPCSFGRVSVQSASIVLQSSSHISIQGKVSIDAESTEVVQQTQLFVQQFAGSLVSESDYEKSSRNSEYSVHIPEFSMSVDENHSRLCAEDVQFCSPHLSCKQLQVSSGDSLARLRNVAAIFGEDTAINFDSIDKLETATCSLVEPIKQGKTVFLKTGVLVQVPSVEICLLEAVSCDGSSTSNSGLPTLPFPVRFESNHVCLHSQRDPACVASARSICIALKPINTSVEMRSLKKMTAKLTTRSGEWVSASIDIFCVVVSDKSLVVENMQTDGVLLGPCSFGKLSCRVPSLSFSSKGAGIVVGGSIDGVLESTAFIERLKNFVADAVNQFETNGRNPHSGESFMSLPFPAVIPAVSVLIEEGETQSVLKQIRAHGTALQCEGFSFVREGGASAQGRGIEIDVSSGATISFRSIEEMTLPNFLQLSERCDIYFEWDGEVITAKAPSMRFNLLNEQKGGNKKEANKNSWPVPFPVRVVMGDIRLNGWASDTGTCLSASQIDLCVKVAGEQLSAETQQVINLKLASKADFLRTSIQPSTAVLSSTGGHLTLRQLTFGGAYVGPCSHGKLSIRVPRAVYLPRTNELAAQGAMEAFIESSVTAKRIKAFVSAFAAAPNRTKSDSCFSLPFALTIPRLVIGTSDLKAKATVEKIKVDQHDIQFASTHCSESGGSSVSVVDVKASLLPELAVEVGMIYTLHIPGVMDVAGPTSSVALSIKDGCLRAAMASLHVELPESNVVDSTCSSGGPASTPVVLPFSIRLLLDDFYMKISDEYFIGAKGTDVSVSQVGTSYSMQTFGTFRIRLEHESQDKVPNSADARMDGSSSWVEASVSPATLVIHPYNAGFEVQKLNCNGVSLGPCSFGHFAGQIPEICMMNRGSCSELRLKGSLDVTIASWELGQRLQLLMQRFVPSSQATNQTFSLQLPKVMCSIQSPKAQIIAQNISYDGTAGSIEMFHCAESTGLSSSVRGVRFALTPEVNVVFGRLEHLFVPGVMKLTSPVIDASISFHSDSLTVDIKSVAVALLGGVGGASKGKAESREGIPLRCPVRLFLQEVKVQPVANLPCSEIRLAGIDLRAMPESVTAPREPERLLRPGVKLMLHHIASIDHEMFRCSNISASGVIFPPSADAIHRLSITASSASVTTGFSSVEWSALLSSGGDTGSPSHAPIKMPFARIGAIKLSLAYRGIVVSAAETPIDIPPFVGNATTSLHDIKAHFSQAVLQRAPGLLANIEVLGSNVVESTFTNVGRVAGLSAGSVPASTLAGSAIGSVAGLAVIDSVKGAVAAGKKSRGVSADEPYQFGDFSRGIARSVRAAARSGAVQHRGENGSYVPGDFIAGSTAAAGQYAQNNKSRLGSAGGGGVGMAIGSALAGPVGFVAGSYLGSMVGGAALEDGNKKSGCQQSHLPDSSQGNIPQRRGRGVPAAAQSSEHDLLGIGMSDMKSTLPVRKELEQVDLLSFGPPVASGTAVQPQHVSHYNRQAPQSTVGSTFRGDDYSNARGFSEPRHHTEVSQQTRSSAGTSGCADLLGLGVPSVDRPFGQDASNASPAGVTSPVPYVQSSQQQATCCSAYPGLIHEPHGQQPRQQQQVRAQRPQHQLNNSSSAYTSDTSHASHRGGQGGGGAPTSHGSGQGPAEEHQGYRFGDITKGIIARGKLKDGRHKDSGYKFGDFTRGLLG